MSLSGNIKHYREPMNNNTNEEVWKDIKGYEGLYMVSSFGNVKSLNYRRSGIAKNLKLKNTTNGYKAVILAKEGKHKDRMVHRLVAEAFIPNPKNLPQVNHKDEDKHNNRVENLEWCTAKYNSNYGTGKERMAKSLTGKKHTDEHRKARSEWMTSLRVGEKHPMFGKEHSKEARMKMSESRKKPVICIDTGQIFDSAKEAGEFVGTTTVGDCCNGKYKTSGGYRWRWLE